MAGTVCQVGPKADCEHRASVNCKYGSRGVAIAHYSQLCLAKTLLLGFLDSRLN